MTAAFSGPRWPQAGLILLTLYVIAGVSFSFLMPGTPRFSDEREYLQLTDHLIHGPGFSMDGTHLTAIRSPGYPFFLAAIEALGGGIVATRVIQFLLVAATVLLIAQMLPKKHRNVSVLAATGVVIVYPLFFYTTLTLYPQTLSAFLFILALAILVLNQPGWIRPISVGAVFGFLILVVPTFLLTLFVVLAAAWFFKIARWWECLLIAVVASVMVGSWTVRNYVEFHEFVPVASNSGANFLIGNCENTIPTGGSGNIDRTHYRDEAQKLGLNEFQEDHYYREQAVRWITDHPGRAFLLYLEKTANFFNVYNDFAPENKGEITLWKQVVLGLCYALLLALLIWRLLEIKCYPLTTTEKFFLTVFVLSAFTSALFFTRIRLRLPYDYLIVTVIAMHLARRLSAVKEQ